MLKCLTFDLIRIKCTWHDKKAAVFKYRKKYRRNKNVKIVLVLLFSVINGEINFKRYQSLVIDAYLTEIGNNC